MRISDWSSDVCSSDLLSTVLHRRRTEGLEPFEGRIGKRCSNRSGGIEVVHPGAAQGGDQLCAVRQADPARHVCSQEAAGACQALVFEGEAKRTRLAVRCAGRLLIAWQAEPRHFQRAEGLELHVPAAEPITDLRPTRPTKEKRLGGAEGVKKGKI